MAKNRPQYFELDAQGAVEIRRFIDRGNGFHHIGSSEVPSAVPAGLRANWDSAVALVTGSTGADGAVMILGHRVDDRAGKLDHDPFVLAVSASVPHGSGVLLHHASYPSRSIDLPPGYVAAATSSGIFNYFRDHPPYGARSGSTGEAPSELVAALDLAKRFLGSSGAT